MDDFFKRENIDYGDDQPERADYSQGLRRNSNEVPALTKRSGAGWDVAQPGTLRTHSTEPNLVTGQIQRLDYPGWELDCEHPNEVPLVCPCIPTCGCRVRHCAKPRPCPSPGLLELGKINRDAIAKENALKTSQFTRMHFEVVAGVLRAIHAPTEIAEAFAETFARYNPNFNRQRFLGAATGAV